MKYFFTLLFFVSLTGFVFLSYEGQTQNNQIHFKFLYKNATLNCDTVLQNSERLSVLQFYLARLTFNGTLLLDEKSMPVFLIGNTCPDTLDTSITLKEGIKGIGTLNVTLGVPFELNHTNPLKAPFPLNQSDMFWTWQLGHKFLRLDTVSESKSWSFHLGSTGCKAPSSMRSPEGECTHPNRFKYKINNFDTSKPIYFHLDRLSESVENDIDCMSNPTSDVCKTLFKNLHNSNVFSQARMSH